MEFCLLLARRDLKAKESNFLFLTPNYFSSESPDLRILGSPGDLGTSEAAVSAATQTKVWEAGAQEGVRGDRTELEGERDRSVGLTLGYEQAKCSRREGSFRRWVTGAA